MSIKKQKAGRPLSVETCVTGKVGRGEYAKRLLKVHLSKAGVDYEELSSRLKVIGVVEPAAILNRKINRGTFSADFFLQCLLVIGVVALPLEEVSVPAIQSLSDALASVAKGNVRRKR